MWLFWWVDFRQPFGFVLRYTDETGQPPRSTDDREQERAYTQKSDISQNRLPHTTHLLQDARADPFPDHGRRRGQIKHLHGRGRLGRLVVWVKIGK